MQTESLPLPGDFGSKPVRASCLSSVEAPKLSMRSERVRVKRKNPSRLAAQPGIVTGRRGVVK